ncbi:MAG TPA: hypothetical protein VFS15_28035 [Kofleriaceae bacterium]|nr:hypothetical protein [Kofleriaceae bacterium]
MRIWVCLLLAACSGSAHQIEIGAPPAKVTQGVFAGPLCSGDRCSCATAPADAGVPTDGRKRFEVKLDSPNQLWITVADNQMYKSPERATECFYIDLPSGDTPVEMRASEPNGVAGTWTIRELGTQTKSFYDTFTFSCGNPGACSFEELREKKAEYKDPKRDRCGSVKVKGLTWDTGRSPDMEYPSELLVRATLDVYRFEPDRPHGADCSTKQADEHTEDNPKY